MLAAPAFHLLRLDGASVSLSLLCPDAKIQPPPRAQRRPFGGYYTVALFEDSPPPGGESATKDCAQPATTARSAMTGKKDARFRWSWATRTCAWGRCSPSPLWRTAAPEPAWLSPRWWDGSLWTAPSRWWFAAPTQLSPSQSAPQGGEEQEGIEEQDERNPKQFRREGWISRRLRSCSEAMRPSALSTDAAHIHGKTEMCCSPSAARLRPPGRLPPIAAPPSSAGWPLASGRRGPVGGRCFSARARAESRTRRRSPRCTAGLPPDENTHTQRGTRVFSVGTSNAVHFPPFRCRWWGEAKKQETHILRTRFTFSTKLPRLHSTIPLSTPTLCTPPITHPQMVGIRCRRHRHTCTFTCDSGTAYSWGTAVYPTRAWRGCVLFAQSSEHVGSRGHQHISAPTWDDRMGNFKSRSHAGRVLA